MCKEQFQRVPLGLTFINLWHRLMNVSWIRHFRMDNSIVAENSATGLPEICYCSGKTTISNILQPYLLLTWLAYIDATTMGTGGDWSPNF